MQNRNVFINHSNIALSVFDKLKKIISTHTTISKTFKNGYELRYPTEKTYHIPERVGKEIYIETTHSGRHTVGIFPNDPLTLALVVNITLKLDLDIGGDECNEILNNLFSNCIEETKINLLPEFYYYSDKEPNTTYGLVQCHYGHNLISINDETLKNLCTVSESKTKMRDELAYLAFNQLCLVAGVAPYLENMLSIIDRKHNTATDISSLIMPLTTGSHQV